MANQYSMVSLSRWKKHGKDMIIQNTLQGHDYSCPRMIIKLFMDQYRLLRESLFFF